MFFSLAKLIWPLICPSHVLAGLLLAAFACQCLRWRRLAQSLVATAALLFVGIGILPLWTFPVRALEDQYPRPPWPAHVAGVVILSGGFDTPLLQSRGVPAPEESLSRLIGGLEVARHYPQARLIFSGGTTGHDPAMTDAVAARYFLAQLGADTSRLILEDRSRDTYENLVFSRQLADPKPGEVWLLATSAIHMPRAMAAAERVGWKLVPWPTDYVTRPNGWRGLFYIPHNLQLSDYAAHEWLGLLAYRFRAPPAGAR